MKPRSQRMLAVGVILVGISAAAVLVMQAFEENAMFFRSPTDVVTGAAAVSRIERVLARGRSIAVASKSAVGCAGERLLDPFLDRATLLYCSDHRCRRRVADDRQRTRRPP